MGEGTKIEWADHTFNPWWGCTRVPRIGDAPGSACDHCYAATWAARWGVGWGANAAPRLASEKFWREPLAWNRKALADGVRRRVFCLSMGDVFEARGGEHGATLIAQRGRLWKLIEDTPGLDWLLLTKRPENVSRMVPASWLESWPAHAWVGTTIACQQDADVRVPLLLTVPARARFLSVEPMLGAMDLSFWIAPVSHCGKCGAEHGGILDLCPSCGLDSLVTTWGSEQADRYRTGERYDEGSENAQRDLDEGCALSWVIVGGESGHGARPMHPQWVRSLRDQCVAAAVPFFFKQWGEWAPRGSAATWTSDSERTCNDEGVSMLADGRILMRDRSVAELARCANGRPAGYADTRLVVVDQSALEEWHEAADTLGYQWMYRVGKRDAGRLLDGRTWDEVPS